MKKFRKDIRKYKYYSNKSAINLLLTQQGLWAIFQYRVANNIHSSKIPKLFKKLLLMFCLIWQKWTEIITGISLPYSAKIGAGLYIGHFGNIIVNANTVMGENCNISQGVTIGVSGRGEKRGVPIIGNNVYFGANAVVAGKIHIGDNVVVGANSLVTSDVGSGITVLGVPAIKVSEKNSEGYI